MLTLTVILNWLFLGGFICHKRKWYSNKRTSYDSGDQYLCVVFTFLCSPIALLISLFKEMILDDWNNNI